MSIYSIQEELSKGGEWLSATKTWMQNNIPRGDTILWSSHETVKVPFRKLQDLTLIAASQAIQSDRQQTVIRLQEIQETITYQNTEQGIDLLAELINELKLRSI